MLTRWLQFFVWLLACLVPPRFAPLTDPLAREGEGGEGEGGEGGEGGDGDGEGSGGGEGGEGGEGGQAGGGLLTGKTGDQGGEFVIPDKFLIKGEDGNPDHKAILEKMLPSYTGLEKRLTAGEAVPESPDKYKIDNYLPDGFERNPDREKIVMAGLHEAGLNNKQAQGVLNLFGELLGGAVAEEQATMQAATAELQGEWGKDFEARMARSNFALSQAPEALVAKFTSDPKLMNNPAVIRLLDFVGQQFDDDHMPDEMGDAEIADIDALRNSEAYTDTKHPDHKATVAKVTAAYERGYKSKKSA